MKLFSIKKKPVAKASKEAKVKNSLLHTYLTSLLSLVLCVAMFLGTSFAWFTSEVENKGNEIYIGTLDVELEKQVADGTDEDTEPDYISLDNSEEKLFDSGIRWEPGYTALETIKITNKGDLAFRYELNFTDGKLTVKDADDNDVDDTAKSLGDVAKYFEVRVYKNGSENTVPNYASLGDGWSEAVDLDKLLSGEAVLGGEMDKDDVYAEKATADTYTIALHMKEDADSSVMGRKISLNVKLVAYQMTSESDAFGDKYDTFVAVSNAEELTSALAAGGNVVLINDIDLEESIALNEEVYLDLNGKKLTSNNVVINTNHVVVSNGDWLLEPNTGAPPVIVNSKLTLTNMNVSCNKMFYTYNNYGEAVGISVEGGILTMKDSSIVVKANVGTQYSYAYCVGLMNGATFDMEGGELIAFEPTGTGEAGESSYAVMANGSGTMNASLKDVKIDAHYIAGANTATLNITQNSLSFDSTRTQHSYTYQGGKCNFAVE